MGLLQWKRRRTGRRIDKDSANLPRPRLSGWRAQQKGGGGGAIEPEKGAASGEIARPPRDTRAHHSSATRGVRRRRRSAGLEELSTVARSSYCLRRPRLGPRPRNSAVTSAFPDSVRRNGRGSFPTLPAALPSLPASAGERNLRVAPAEPVFPSHHRVLLPFLRHLSRAPPRRRPGPLLWSPCRWEAKRCPKGSSRSRSPVPAQTSRTPVRGR